MEDFKQGQEVIIKKSQRRELIGRRAIVKAVGAFQRGYLTLKIGKSKKIWFLPAQFVKAAH